MSTNTKPLSGIKVLDFSSLYPGPLFSLLLHDLGCLVVKAESPKKPDLLRSTSSNSFQALNRGKLSISLDFNSISDSLYPSTQNALNDFSASNTESESNVTNAPSIHRDRGVYDLRWLRNWISKFDVIIDTSRPGVLERRLHVKDIDEARKIWPHIIFVRISAYGTVHPKQNIENIQNNNHSKKNNDNCQPFDKLKFVPSHDMNALGRAGVFSMISTKEDQHTLLPLPVQIVDILIAYSACAQTVAAIYRRKMLSEQYENNNSIYSTSTTNLTTSNSISTGSLIDVSMYDAAVSTLIMPLTEMMNHPKTNLTNGSDLLCGSVPCYNIYRTANGLLSVGCIELPFWISFLKILGLESKYASSGFISDFEQLKSIKREIENKLQEKTAEEWEEIFMIKYQLPITKLRNLMADRDLIIKEMECRNMISETQYGTKVIKPCLDYVSFLGLGKNTDVDEKIPKKSSEIKYIMDIGGKNIAKIRVSETAPGVGQHNHLLSSL